MDVAAAVVVVGVLVVVVVAVVEVAATVIDPAAVVDEVVVVVVVVVATVTQSDWHTTCNAKVHLSCSSLPLLVILRQLLAALAPRVLGATE